MAVYQGETPYLVRVTYDSGRVFECVWGTKGPLPTGPSPGSPTRGPGPESQSTAPPPGSTTAPTPTPPG
jgi:hypothetical protein